MLLYAIMGTINSIIGVLLAVTRIILLLIFSVLEIQRLDRSIFANYQMFDGGYMAFYGIILMTESMKAQFEKGRPEGDMKALQNFR